MYLDDWIKRKIGISQKEELTREAIEKYQLSKLVETVFYVKENSSFYWELFKEIKSEDIKSLEDIRKLPFTKVSDLKERELDFLCVKQNDISRIVTLNTSGTTGDPKRVHYTSEDQELTIDFFHNGMRNLVDEKDVVLILLPCQTPGCVGDLLYTGLERLGARPVRYGLIKPDFSDCMSIIELMEKEGITSMVGAPHQVHELAKLSILLETQDEWENRIRKIKNNMNSVLLSTEYIPSETCELINRAWNCKVFEHYGMTEMGLGGAVACYTLEGYHPREADLYFEIIDPKTGEVVPDGQFGEVVFTTLTRKGMPLVRYRTGDISRWIPEDCKCNSILRRLDKVGRR